MYSVSLSVSCLPHLNLSASVQGLQMGIPLTFLHASSSGAAQTASSLLRRSLRHLLLQRFEALMVSLKDFSDSPQEMLQGVMPGVSFLSLGSFPIAHLYQVTCKSKLPRKALLWPTATTTVCAFGCHV